MRVAPSASHVGANDTLRALCDAKEPTRSSDQSLPRFTFWDHRGTREWVRYDFERPCEIESVAVYWFDDRPDGACRVPKSWALEYNDGYAWKPVAAKSEYGTARDQYNTVRFERVTAAALRIVVEQRPGMSSGILEWQVDGRTPSHGHFEPRLDAGEGSRFPGYLGPWLILDAWDATFQGADREMKDALAQLENAIRTLFETPDSSGEVGPDAASHAEVYSQARKTLEQLDARYPPDALLKRLHAKSPTACLQLMTRLDWLRQDQARGLGADFKSLARAVIAEVEGRPSSGEPTNARPVGEMQSVFDELMDAEMPPWDRRWMRLYVSACEARRRQRLAAHDQALRRIVFTKHHDIGGQHYAYTEDVSDSPYNDNNPFPHGGALCLLEMEGLYGRVRVLLDEPDGLIRDPDVSYDGRRILFSRRTSMTDDDYHLYEMTVDDESVRQLTFGQGAADYEGAYLPGGDIIFNSSRCQQIVDCWWSDVSNLYACDADGGRLRRLGFDQVHTNYPQVMPDGRVIYTRWDYNDRGQLFPQPLFQMNPDGTQQREFYGNNSWFPTTILHARGIPGSHKVVCVLSGHHTYQKGKLAIIDPRLGRQENAGVQLIAPVRETEAVRVDKYGYQGEQFQYPFALSETEFLVTWSPEGSLQGRAPAETPFGVYFMTIDGRRELLAADPNISCNQAVPLAPREEPPLRANAVDMRTKCGTYYVQDVHAGPGLAGVPRGTIKRLRVVALEFRAAGIGSNSNRGPAGGALVSTPISIGGAWDVKRILGTAKVHDDGSACFKVPARTPIYFQALDENNRAVQTMRSWSTLQPGEAFSCVGCHEPKNVAPPSVEGSLALEGGPQELDPFYGPPRGFSFAREIQPILDAHCTSCHDRETVASGKSAIRLEGRGELDPRSRKRWSDAYRALADPKYCNWVSPQSAPPMLPPYHAGATQSRLIEMLQAGHEGVELSREAMDKIACWIDLGIPFCGDYTEAMDPSCVPQYEHWLDRRRHWESQETGYELPGERSFGK